MTNSRQDCWKEGECVVTLSTGSCFMRDDSNVTYIHQSTVGTMGVTGVDLPAPGLIHTSAPERYNAPTPDSTRHNDVKQLELSDCSWLAIPIFRCATKTQ